jgi:hypothetical protein
LASSIRRNKRWRMTSLVDGSDDDNGGDDVSDDHET